MFLCIDFGSTNLVLGPAYHRTLGQGYLTIKNGTVFSADQALESFYGLMAFTHQRADWYAEEHGEKSYAFHE